MGIPYGAIGLGVVSLIGWVVYGVGCIIYLRLNGMEIR